MRNHARVDREIRDFLIKKGFNVKVGDIIIKRPATDERDQIRKYYMALISYLFSDKNIRNRIFSDETREIVKYIYKCDKILLSQAYNGKISFEQQSNLAINIFRKYLQYSLGFPSVSYENASKKTYLELVNRVEVHCSEMGIDLTDFFIENNKNEV